MVLEPIWARAFSREPRRWGRLIARAVRLALGRTENANKAESAIRPPRFIRYYAFSETALRKSGPFGAAAHCVWCGVTSCRTLRAETHFMADAFTSRYEELLDGNYDCVDRIV